MRYYVLVGALTLNERSATSCAHHFAYSFNMQVAAAEAEAVKIIGEALKEYNVDATQYLIGLRYIETMTNIVLRASRRIVHLTIDTELYGALKILEDSA